MRLPSAKDFSSTYFNPYIEGIARLRRLPLFVQVALCVAIFIAVVLVSGLLYLNRAHAFSSGSGTISDPYVITSCAQLESINDDPENLHKNYVLGNNIDCTGITFIPIGFGLLSGNGSPYTTGQHDDYDMFTGRFDGAGHTISNITSTSTANESAAGDGEGFSYSFVGIFSYLGGAYVHDLIIDNASTSAYQYGGALAGAANEATIIGVQVENSTVTGYYTNPTPGFSIGASQIQSIGGMVGYAIDSHIAYSSVTNTLVQKLHAFAQIPVTGIVFPDGYGGFAGRSSGSSFESLFSTATVTAPIPGVGGNSQTSNGFGGIVGVGGGDFANVYSSTTINASYAGGIIGDAEEATTTITNSYFSGTMYQGAGGGFQEAVGGLVGSVLNGAAGTDVKPHLTITNSFSTGSIPIDFNNDPGAIVGKTNLSVDAVISMSNVQYYANGTDDGGCYNEFSDDTFFTPDQCVGNDSLSYFNSSSNAPLSSWDFTNTWQTTAGSPTLRAFPYSEPTQTETPVASCSALKTDILANPRGWYSLSGNLDCSGENLPLGGMTPDMTFMGTLEGNGHTISGISIATTSREMPLGLFARAFAATIQDVNLTGAGISKTQGEDHNDNDADGGVGALAGRSGALILSNVHSTVPISSSVSPDIDFDMFTNVGGLVGTAGNISIENSSVAADIDAPWTFNTGGLAGTAYWADIRNSTFTGALNAESDGGGLVGNAYLLNFNGVYASTTMGCDDYCGALAGSVNGEAVVGGLLPNGGKYSNASSTITNSSSTVIFTDATSALEVEDFLEYVGGFVGASEHLNLRNVFSKAQAVLTQDTDGEEIDYFGGLVGSFNDLYKGTSESDVSNASSTVNFLFDTPNDGTVLFVGGLFGADGSNKPSSFTNVSASTTIVAGLINPTGDSELFGGLIGDACGNTLSLQNATTTYAISVLSDDGEVEDMGGAMGETCYNSGTIDNLHATGSISVDGSNPTKYIGGISGDLEDVDVSHTYASSTIDLADLSGQVQYIGGIGGDFEQIPDSVSTTFATSSITIGGTSMNLTTIGGFAGYLSGAVVASSSAISTLTVNGDSDTQLYGLGGFAGELYDNNDPFDTGVSDSYASTTITMDMDSPTYIGGFAGDTDDITLARVFSAGSIVITGANAGGSSGEAFDIGGLVGDIYGDIINDAYSTVSVSVDSDPALTSGEAGTWIGAFGGALDASNDESSSVQNIYSVGPLTLTAADTVTYGQAGGLIGGSSDSSNSLQNAFTASVVSVPDGSDEVGAILGGYSGSETLLNNAYGTTGNPDLLCTGDDVSDPEWCTAVADNTDFYTKTNAPLSSWDFDSIWQQNDCTYPTLQFFSLIFGADICGIGGGGPTPTAPTVSTQAASSVTDTTATLNGSIDDIGTSAPTTRGFAYGTDTAYGATTTESGSFSAGSFSDALSSLTCNTTYHFISYATSPDGTGYGSDTSFTTSACSSGGGGGGGATSTPSSGGSSGSSGQVAPIQVPPPVISPVVPPVTPIEPPASSTSGISGQSAAPTETLPVPPAAPVETVTPPPTPTPYVTVPSITNTGLPFPAIADLALKVFIPDTATHNVALAAGIALGLLGIIWTFASGAYALTDIPALIVRGFQSPFVFGFIRRKKRYETWGTVYDSQTKRGLDPAIVTLYDASGNEVKQAVTDLDGRFGFDVAAGTYALTAGKTNHIFPARNLPPVDPIYSNRYEGGPIPMPTPGVLIKDVPLDPTQFDWNEAQKYHNGFLRFYSRFDRPLAYLSMFATIVGAALAAVSVVIDVSAFNLVLFGLYALMGIAYAFDFAPRLYGSVRTKDGDFLANALIRVKSAATGSEVGHTVTDHLGRYYLLVPPADHATMTVEKLTAPDTYVKLWEESVKTKKGYLNTKIRVG